MIEAWIVAHGDSVKTILFFSLFAAFGVVEALAPARRDPPRRKQRWTANLVLTAFNVAVILSLPVTFLSAAMWSQKEGLGLFNTVGLPLGVFVVGNLLARSFISFFTHYLYHKVPLLWRVHRVHHFDTELDVSTTVRFHPLEFVINLATGVPIVIAFGLSPWVLLVYEILNAGVTVFSHSNVRLPAPVERVLRHIVVTPDLHRVHHSSWRPETDSNFGALFPIWDIVFGTFRACARAPHETMPLGLDEVRDGRESRLGWLLASPFIGRINSG